jgi:hypothetical protein
MRNDPGLAEWTAEQIEVGRRWVATWREAGRELERIKRRELRALDTYRAIAHLCAPRGSVPVPAPRTTSGLIEQQRLFMKAARHY